MSASILIFVPVYVVKYFSLAAFLFNNGGRQFNYGLSHYCTEFNLLVVFEVLESVGLQFSSNKKVITFGEKKKYAPYLELCLCVC